MGKSEIQSLPIARPEHTLICASTNYKAAVMSLSTNEPKAIEETIEQDMVLKMKKLELPDEMEMFTNQVAGHVIEKNGIGMLKQNGLVFKPVIKKECGECEINFYEMLEKTVDRSFIELRNLVPKYYGVKKISTNGKEYDFICLEDLTRCFKEPCIMDIKIGRRTWDPNATYEKIISEEKKYHECKRDLGFCIPGFQVYNIYDNELIKCGTDFGKTLDKESAEEAIKTFLNADGNGFCRRLIVQFLAVLWRIQHWARNQRSVRIYSSSILLVYDARRLREHVRHYRSKSTLKLTRKGSLYRPMSLAVLNNERIPTGFSGQLTKEGPILRPPACLRVSHLEVPSVVNNNTIWQKSLHTLKRTHSFQNDYDKDVQNKKQTYAYVLEDLCCDQKSEVWATAKMIDFAHVFPSENCEVDKNYLEGIENLIRIFEEFLVESE